MGDRTSATAPVQRAGLSDPASKGWVEQLHRDHPRHEQAIVRLHDILHRAAVHELRRRRGHQRPLAGPEFDDVAQQCADDAVMSILARVDDFRGLSRFTTWAYKFVVFEVSSDARRKLRAALAAAGHPPSDEDARA